ncbi:hypothetical protein [Marinoscillum sp. 108]|jgi:hypothetical protein|uniref:Uncharacterized protein n=1 Tax=Marinoscillum luteum TaxID=861051 RepID=A0ABW7N3B4_9BACT|nr:hypothetical protein [Marinoscillum sp. 108]VXD21450.1 hypothetical protein MARINOS108_90119 [Marinoscillum sp. 108]
MDIQAEKYSLIEYISQIADITLVEKLKQFVKANEQDFWNDLTLCPTSIIEMIKSRVFLSSTARHPSKTKH